MYEIIWGIPKQKDSTFSYRFGDQMKEIDAQNHTVTK